MEVLLESQLGNIDETGVMLEQYLEALSLSPSGPTTSYARASAMIPYINRISHGADRSDLARKWAKTVLASPSVAPLLTFDARVGISLLAVQQHDVTQPGSSMPNSSQNRAPFGQGLWPSPRRV